MAQLTLIVPTNRYGAVHVEKVGIKHHDHKALLLMEHYFDNKKVLQIRNVAESI